MTAGGDWGEIIDKEEAERFVGREQELETFRQQRNHLKVLSKKATRK